MSQHSEYTYVLRCSFSSEHCNFTWGKVNKCFKMTFLKLIISMVYSVYIPKLIHDGSWHKFIKSLIFFTYCFFPGYIVTWAWSLPKGSTCIWFHGFWLAPPKQRYWQNRETANVGQDSSVGRAPARQSGGRRFKSHSSKFFFVHPNLSFTYFLLNY